MMSPPTGYGYCNVCKGPLEKRRDGDFEVIACSDSECGAYYEHIPKEAAPTEIDCIFNQTTHTGAKCNHPAGTICSLPCNWRVSEGSTPVEGRNKTWEENHPTVKKQNVDCATAIVCDHKYEKPFPTQCIICGDIKHEAAPAVIKPVPLDYCELTESVDLNEQYPIPPLKTMPNPQLSVDWEAKYHALEAENKQLNEDNKLIWKALKRAILEGAGR